MAEKKIYSMEKFSKVVVSAILRQDKRILIMKRSRDFKGLTMGKDLWELPGGTVEFGEDLIAALHREIKEETAIALQAEENTRLVSAVAYTVGDQATKSYRVNLFYEIELPDNGHITLSEEHSEYQFIHSDFRLNDLNMLPSIRAVVTNQLSK